jgi:hypothetical protein
MGEDRSAPQAGTEFIYTPSAVDPLLMMLIILVAIVTLIGLPVTLVDRPEYDFIGALGPAGAALCLSPLLALALAAFLLRPTQFRVGKEGMRFPVPRVLASTGRAPLVRYEDVRNAYVTAVESAGAKLSPFASSAGSVLHLGIGVETRDGRTYVAKFTPSRLAPDAPERALCLQAIEAIRARMGALGRPLVQEPPRLDEQTLARNLEAAQRPLLPFPAIVASFFVLPLNAFVVLYVTGAAGLSPEVLRWALAAAAAAAPALLMLHRAFERNARRDEAINEVAKHRTWQEESGSRG